MGRKKGRMGTGETNQQSLPYPALGPPKNSCAPLFRCIELSPSLLRGDKPKTSYRSRLRIIRGCAILSMGFRCSYTRWNGNVVIAVKTTVQKREHMRHWFLKMIHC